MTIRLTVEADGQKTGMTFAELAEFVDRARQAGAVDSDVLRARITMGGRVKDLRLMPPDRLVTR